MAIRGRFWNLWWWIVEQHEILPNFDVITISAPAMDQKLFLLLVSEILGIFSIPRLEIQKPKIQKVIDPQGSRKLVLLVPAISDKGLLVRQFLLEGTQKLANCLLTMETPFTKHDLRTHKLKNKVIRFVRNLVSWRVTCRHILKRNLMLVSNVARVSLILATWRHIRWQRGRSLTHVSNATKIYSIQCMQETYENTQWGEALFMSAM